LEWLRALFGGKPARAALPPAPAREVFRAEPKELFTREVEAWLAGVEGIESVKRLEAELTLEVVTSKGTNRAYLGNLFDETREVPPEERPHRFALFFSAVLDAGEEQTWEDARQLLVPALKGATFGIEAWVADPKPGFVRRPFLPLIDEVAVVDRPTSMAFVSAAVLDKWELDPQALFAAVDQRLHLLGDPALELYDRQVGPLWTVATNDCYEPSRLLVPGWLASLRGKVEGNPIAIIPERAMLLVGGDARPEMVERLVDMADREFAASNRRISPGLYTVDAEGRVIPFLRKAGEPLAEKLKVAHLKLALYEYEEQKNALDKHHETSGPDVFVASLKAFQTPGGLPRSICYWTHGVRSWLPQSERVLLVVLEANERGEQKVGRSVEVPFERLAERLTLVPGVHPARWETTRAFPTEAELDALEAGTRPPGH
jgi:hypothetical protein